MGELTIRSIKLNNFRCFADCSLELNSKLSVLVAENGRGKTAILDAIAMSLGLYIDQARKMREHRGLQLTDVRLGRDDNGSMIPALPTACEIWGEPPLHWKFSRNSFSRLSRSTVTWLRGPRNFDSSTAPQHEGEAQGRVTLDLPFVGYYGTSRLWKTAIRKSREFSAWADENRLDGYRNCLTPRASFNGLEAWYEGTMARIADPRFKADTDRNVALIRAVQEAAAVVLEPTGWINLTWDGNRKKLVVEHEDGTCLPVSSLSDGVRNMVALTADIARRCAMLNPHHADQAARLSSGVLLIDEVDMHLHPRWQQMVLGLFQKSFPLLQIVVSTHSPHVLSAVDARSIFVIKIESGHAKISNPEFQTKGVESADILARVMNVDPIPHVEEAGWLSEYRAAVQADRYESEEPKKLWERIIGHFGPDHPALNEIDTLRRLQEFRRANNLPKSERTT